VAIYSFGTDIKTLQSGYLLNQQALKTNAEHFQNGLKDYSIKKLVYMSLKEVGN